MSQTPQPRGTSSKMNSATKTKIPAATTTATTTRPLGFRTFVKKEEEPQVDDDRAALKALIEHDKKQLHSKRKSPTPQKKGLHTPVPSAARKRTSASSPPSSSQHLPASSPSPASRHGSHASLLPQSQSQQRQSISQLRKDKQHQQQHQGENAHLSNTNDFFDVISDLDQEGEDDDYDEDDEENEDDEEDLMSACLYDPEMKAHLARKTLSLPLARFAQKLREIAKDKAIGTNCSEFNNWNLEEMIRYGLADGESINFHLGGGGGGGGDSDDEDEDDDENDENEVSSSQPGGGGGGGGDGKLKEKQQHSFGSPRPKKKKKKSNFGEMTPAREAENMRSGFKTAFDPLKIDLKNIFTQMSVTGEREKIDLRSFDQKLTFLKKKLLMEEAIKRKSSVRYIREITSTLRKDEKLFDNFSSGVRAQQAQRFREHRDLQRVLDSQRSMYQERSTRQRAVDFTQIENLRRSRAESTRVELEETFYATCENQLAMRRGTAFSRQCAWMPLLIFVVTVLKFSKALQRSRATAAEERLIEAAHRDFSNIFVPTRVTGFLKLAQGYKDAAKKKTLTGEDANVNDGDFLSPASRVSKEQLRVQTEIRKKREHYAELKKQELEHPQWCFDRLFAQLRHLQFPTLLRMYALKLRQRSAGILTSFLRTLFQQTVIRVRCKAYLKYVRATGHSFHQAIKNRRTRRNFMWVLQFKNLVQERRFYDLSTCVESDHVLQRRERIRQKCAAETKKALEVADALRKKLVAAQAAAVHAKEAAASATAALLGPSSPTSPSSPSSLQTKQQQRQQQNQKGRPGTTTTTSSSSSTGGGGGGDTRPSTGAFSPTFALNTSALNSPQQSPIRSNNMNNNNDNNNSFSLSSPNNTSSSHNNVLASPSTHNNQHNHHHYNAQLAHEVEVVRTLCAPFMIPHPYGKFGPHPREASTVARATMEHFRVTEIKWMPSETAMGALLDYVLKVEDRWVYEHFRQWIRTNREHRERADFLESVLSHLRADASQRADLEAQYKELLERRPAPPRQPFVLPDSEMRIIVHAAYTLTAQEKRAAQLSKVAADGPSPTSSSSSSSSGGGGGSSGKDEVQQNPLYVESNVKSHLAKAMSLFEGLHGNVRPFLLATLQQK